MHECIYKTNDRIADVTAWMHGCTQGFKTDQSPALEAVLWIRIRIHLTVQDPDSYWECGSGSRGIEIDQNLPRILVSCLLKRIL
jgi:hypothetical protein